MNTQRPFESPPRPPEPTLFPRLLQFQVNRLPQGFPYYQSEAPPGVPRLFGQPIINIVPYPYMDIPAPVPSDPNFPSESAIALPVSAPMTLPPPVPSTSESGEMKRTIKKSAKSAKGVFKCDKCERTYLSYPALYTHIKLKHPALRQVQAAVKPVTNRGRPRKPVLEDEKDLICTAWFEEEGRKGGPTDVLFGFPEAYAAVYGAGSMKYGGYLNHPLYLELAKPHPTEGLKLELEESKGLEEQGEIRQKRQVKCDQVLAEYLRFVAGKVRKEYYVTVVKFVLMYRECMNRASERLNEEKKKLPEILVILPVGGEKGEYCLDNNVEQAPDVCNDFIMCWLPENHPEFNVEEAKGLTMNLCTWLFHNKYTCSSLSLVGGKVS